MIKCSGDLVKRLSKGVKREKGATVSSDAIGLDPSRTHIRHLGVRIWEDQAQFTKIRPIGDFPKGPRKHGAGKE